jgi:hypothetical protein
MYTKIHWNNGYISINNSGRFSALSFNHNYSLVFQTEIRKAKWCEVKSMRIFFTIILCVTAAAHAKTWEVIEDPDELTALFSDTAIEATLKGDSQI